MQAKFHYLQIYALRMLSSAIEHGDLSPAPFCEKCGAAPNGRKLDGHHEDYSKPLDVIWLCPDCHRKEHIRDGVRFYRRRNTGCAIQIALDWLIQHPGYLDTPSRELQESIGVSHMTIHRAQQRLKTE